VFRQGREKRLSAPSDDDFKQMFAYNEFFQAPRALLVYPSATSTPVEHQGQFVGRRHGCGTMHLGLFDGRGWSARQMLAQVRQLLTTLETRQIAITARSYGFWARESLCGGEFTPPMKTSRQWSCV
jgi:hypothetical protein